MQKDLYINHLFRPRIPYKAHISYIYIYSSVNQENFIFLGGQDTYNMNNFGTCRFKKPIV